MTVTNELPTGPFAYRDLDRMGLSRSDLARLLDDGLVRRVTRGAYAPTDMADSVENRARTIALVISPDQVVTDRTAAWIHGIDTFVYSEHDFVPRIDCCALRGNEPSGRDEVNGRTRDLADRDIMEIAGLRVTTPLRTALDLGCQLKRREAKAALDAFARQFGLTAKEIAIEARRYRRRRGVRQLRELIGLVNPKNESVRESWTELAIHDEGLPLPDSQVWIEIDGIPTYRLDFGYPHARVAVEYDGRDWHERTREQIEGDEERREWLRRNGWTVIVVRRGDFTGDGLRRWLDKLREALEPPYSNVRRMERNSRLDVHKPRFNTPKSRFDTHKP